jgi:hypothetical protein
MTGPSENAATKTPTATVPSTNAPIRANGFVRSEENVAVPRSVGKCPQAYSASVPNASAPRRLPIRWFVPVWANPAVNTPSG